MGVYFILKKKMNSEAHSFVAHSPLVKDVDVNPNKDYHLVTGGDDYKIKFWDTRKTSIPLLSFESHYHWLVLFGNEHIWN